MPDSRAPARAPWWRWYEPPRWFPDWLHLRTCTYCRGVRRYLRKQAKGEIRVLS